MRTAPRTRTASTPPCRPRRPGHRRCGQGPRAFLTSCGAAVKGARRGARRVPARAGCGGRRTAAATSSRRHGCWGNGGRNWMARCCGSTTMYLGGRVMARLRAWDPKVRPEAPTNGGHGHGAYRESTTRGNEGDGRQVEPLRRF